jgi:hypothetical protein
MTVVVLSVAVPPAVSASLIVKVVVTVWPGATWWAVGVNTRASRSLVTAAAEPVSV